MRGKIARVTRDKETFFVQRATLGRIETEAIQKYVQTAAVKFEANWAMYEASLEKHLTQSTKATQFKDWVQSKDEFGTVMWTNTQTCEKSMQHPGIKVFQTNKKILRAKAEDELMNSFGAVFDRKLTIVEAMLTIKHRVSREISTARLACIA